MLEAGTNILDRIELVFSTSMRLQYSPWILLIGVVSMGVMLLPSGQGSTGTGGEAVTYDSCAAPGGVGAVVLLGCIAVVALGLFSMKVHHPESMTSSDRGYSWPPGLLLIVSLGVPLTISLAFAAGRMGAADLLVSGLALLLALYIRASLDHRTFRTGVSVAILLVVYGIAWFIVANIAGTCTTIPLALDDYVGGSSFGIALGLGQALLGNVLDVLSAIVLVIVSVALVDVWAFLAHAGHHAPPTAPTPLSS